MPFIYQNLDIQVMNDFVDIEIQPLELGTFKLKPARFRGKNIDERIKLNKKILFLGNAGIGNTTFHRFKILSILKEKSKVPFLEKRKRVIPFYVPLRAIDNTKPLSDLAISALAIELIKQGFVAEAVLCGFGAPAVKSRAF